MYHLAGKSRAVLVRWLTRTFFRHRDRFLSCSPSGRELGSHALDEYISTKAVHWNYGDNIEWPL